MGNVIEVLKSHTGAVLIAGAVCLKVSTLTGSWIPLIVGYSLLLLTTGIYIIKWRDKHDHKN